VNEPDNEDARVEYREFDTEDFRDGVSLGAR
jgi:hypothetical protein